MELILDGLAALMTVTFVAIWCVLVLAIIGNGIFPRH